MSTIFFSTSNITEFKDQAPLPRKFENTNRNASYFSARECLSKIFKYEKLSQKNFNEIEVTDFHKEANHPSVTISLAHTKTYAIATVAYNNQFKGLGVDIEHQERKIKDDSLKYFKNDFDITELSTLELWCVKEACFKALSNSGQEVKLLKEVIIHKDMFYLENKKDTIFAQFQIIKINEHIIVIAYVLNEYKTVDIKRVE